MFATVASAVRFRPATADIDVWTTTSGGVFGGAMPEGQEAARRATRSSPFEVTFKNIAADAVARYPRPPGLDPAVTVMMGIVYGSTR